MELENGSAGDIVDEELNAKLNSLPEETQQIISSFSSFFLEGDVREGYLKNPQKIDVLKEVLKKFGLDEDALGVAMKVFGFESKDETKSSDSI
ncbi:MAG: hypothetical protein WCV81_04435 [Microgenomates group bacterium]|jgi:hypothetical protein